MMSVRQAYADWSATHDSDRNLTRDLDGAVTRTSLAHVRCRAILEIGCGTGKNTVFLATIGERVLALDFSVDMIEKARAKVQSDHVNLAVADITEHWPCEVQSFDLVVCNLVLEHIETVSFIFAEAFRSLHGGGQFFICELHPYRQYQGIQAAFQRDQHETQIPAFVHHISDFVDAAENNGFALKGLKEWWHAQDQNKPPRLVSFTFQK